jgi:hypothetical protein
MFFKKTSANSTLKSFQQPLEEVYIMTLPTSTISPATALSVASSSITENAPTSTSASVGISAATSSSITSAASSAAPAESSGLSAQISSFVKSVVDMIRSVLSKLPLIGQFFALETATSAATTVPVPPPGGSTTLTDDEIVNMIRTQFPSAASATSATVAPATDVCNYCVTLLGQLSNNVVKLEAFQFILTASNCTDAMATQFLQALPDDLKQAIRDQLNTMSTTDLSAQGPRGILAQQAVANVLAAQRTPAGTSAVSGTSGATTTPDTSTSDASSSITTTVI